MQINSGSTSVPPDDTTMVIVRGQRKPMDPARKRDLAARCGIKFIRLRWKSNLSTTVGTSGFQPVYLMTQPKAGGGEEPVARWHKNEFTLEPMAERQMDFIPDEMATGWAYLPDSPFNRVLLAHAELKGNALWDIHDEDIARQIRELANEIQTSVEYLQAVEEADRAATEVSVRVRERGAVTGLGEKTRIEIENEVLKAKIRDEEQLSVQAELKKKLADLQASRGMAVTASATSDTGKLVSVTPVFDAGEAEKARQKMLRDQAIGEIHGQNAELIEQIKKAHLEKSGKIVGWPFSQEYRDKIKPLVDARVKELNEHSTTGGAS